MQLSHEGLGGIGVGPFCHVCNWAGRGAVGKCGELREVIGCVNSSVKYVVRLDLCTICSHLFDTDKGFEIRCSMAAAHEIARSGIGL